MLVHAIVVISNHYHVVLSDPEGRLPEFMAHLHKLVAKCVNASLGRWENLWSSEKPSAVALEKSQDVMDKIVYTACNPVEAGLVAKAKHWPGLIAYLPGQKLTAKRPEIFFRVDGKMEGHLDITLTMPSQFAHLSQDEYAAQLLEEITSKEQVISDDMERDGKSFMGKKAVAKQRHMDRPNTKEPRRQLSPKVACKSKWHRIEALQRLKSFFAEYKQALKSLRDGKRNVIFPAGTYAMRIYAGVRCEPAPAAPPG